MTPGNSSLNILAVLMSALTNSPVHFILCKSQPWLNYSNHHLLAKKLVSGCSPSSFLTSSSKSFVMSLKSRLEIGILFFCISCIHRYNTLSNFSLLGLLRFYAYEDFLQVTYTALPHSSLLSKQKTP